MRFPRSLIPSLLLAGASVVNAVSSWSFNEAVIAVQSKGAGPGFKENLSDRSSLPKPVALEASDSLRIVLTATEDGKGKRPHQAFLLLRDQDTGLETSFPFSMKETGKGKVEFAQKDLPVQLLTSTQPLQATLVLASFGSSKPFSNHIFDLEVELDPNAALVIYEKPLRYGKLAEIHHIFKADPSNPPIIISIFFVLAILAILPALIGSWAFLGANLSHLAQVTKSAPVSHALFFASIFSMEGIFFMYYSSWNLFQTLLAAGIVGLVAFLSGSKALSEVQGRRLAGQR